MWVRRERHSVPAAPTCAKVMATAGSWGAEESWSAGAAPSRGMLLLRASLLLASWWWAAPPYTRRSCSILMMGALWEEEEEDAE